MYRFLDLTLDPQRLELRRAGSQIDVEPQVFSLLVYLIKNRERVVTKDELIESVWDGRIVSDATMSSRISAARTALGDDGKAQLLIRTFPRRGFRFMSEVVEDEAVAASVAPAAPGLEHGASRPTVSEKPTIAILPFQNMSGDPEQDYFVDGIAEDIITALSRFHWFHVISRNTSFTYRDRAVEAKQVAEDLGVRHVLEGSVRRAGNRVRITAQLVDATTGNQVWTERYDRELADIFAVQDEITNTIVGTMEPELGHVEREQASRKPPENIRAWDHFQRGLWHFYQFTDEKNDRARQEFRRAIDSDPDFSQAYAALANVHVLDVVYVSAQSRERSSSEALAAAKKAVALDDRDSFAHYVLGRARLLNRQYDEAVAEMETAITLNPNFAQTYQSMAWALNAMGRHEEAIAFCEKGMELSPHDPYMWGFLTMRSWAHLLLGQYEEAARWAGKAVRLPHAVFWGRATHVSALGHLGRTEEAQASLDELLQQIPHFSSALVKEGLDYWKMPEQIDTFLDGLRKAGVPET